jgi:hypothetical protein
MISTGIKVTALTSIGSHTVPVRNVPLADTFNFRLVYD